jgi:hypothetical protein
VHETVGAPVTAVGDSVANTTAKVAKSSEKLLIALK